MKKLITLFVVLLITSTSSQAGFGDWFRRMFTAPPVNYGAWECLSCNIPAAGSSDSVNAIADITTFIYATNGEIHADEKVARWIPNSTITVCNSTNCLTVIYQASGKWFPIGPATSRGSRDVKVPKNTNPTSGHRPISISYTGPAPASTTQWTITIGPAVPTTWVAPPPAPAKVTYTVTAGPLVVVGQGGEYTPSFTESLNKEFDPGSFESVQPSEGGTYMGGGAGGEGGGIPHSKF